MNPITASRSILVLASLLSSPAWAITTVYPGTLCDFDGAVERPISGARMNASEGYTTTSKLRCPVPRLKPYAKGHALKVKVNVILNNHLSTNPWECNLRTTNAAGTVIHTKYKGIPGANYSSLSWSFSFETIELDEASLSYNFRCNVPDKTGSLAGIVSYEVTE